MKRAPRPRVVVQPQVYQGLQRGIDQMVGAVRPTLGPLPRLVAIEANPRSRMPELVDNAGLIMRRIVALPERDADMGAMFVRQMVWQVHEKVGDGGATAAVLFHSIFRQGIKHVAAGGNAMRLRTFLEQGRQLILDALEVQTQPVRGKHQLGQVAETLCQDTALAQMLGEIFDIIGEYGRLEVRPGRGRALEREYLEGAYWRSSLCSRELLSDRTRMRSELSLAAILISDLTLEEPRDLIPVLEAAQQGGAQSLLVLAQKISPSVIALLLSANREPDKFLAVAHLTPGGTQAQQTAYMADLAVLTGGRTLCRATGETLHSFRPADLGHARRAWAEPEHFGIVGGRADPRHLRAHVAHLRAAAQADQDASALSELRQRIGMLMGGTASLMIGGANETEINTRIGRAERAAQALRAIVREGVVPGGGAALLGCRALLKRQLAISRDLDERAASQILGSAVEVPFRTILANAGYEPGPALAEIDRASAGPEGQCGFGFDVRSGRVVDMFAAGITDGAGVVMAAVHGAVASAALALTTDVLVQHRKPEQRVNP